MIDPYAGEALAGSRRGPRYHGVIARATPRIAAQAAKARVPLVNVWFSSPVQNVPCVLPDMAAGGRMGAEHLIARGLKQFAYLGFQRAAASRAELSGFRAAVERIGATCSALWISHNCAMSRALWGRTIAGMAAWIKTWKLPIGVMGADDLVCRYLIDLCLRKGLRIPEDVAVVGSGNEAILCDEPEPTLSSVDMAAAQIGYRAAELLDELMRGKAPPMEPVLIPPSELVVRNSTDVFAVDDVLVARAMQFIAERGHKPIRVPDVVAALPVTRRSLERRFRAKLGRSIAEEICRLRLERAKRLIVGTTSTLCAIAAATGFSNDDHFNKVFQRLEGMSPGAFRRRHST